MRVTRNLTTTLGLAAGAFVLVAATSAQAGDPCIGDARQTYLDSKAQCKEDFQVAKDDCRDKDHMCMEGCRAGREECALASGLDASLVLCRDALRDAKDDCRADPESTPEEIDQCIDQAQVLAFLCRKAARTAAKPALKACRAGFRACAAACPDDATPVVDKVQCKIDAKNAYLACKAATREEFQTQKDLCRGRDHACVEGCRADRDTCREPVETGLDTDIAACNADRDAELANCDLLYPDPGPARDTCITNAQIDAFQCRDLARETAKPGFQTCRDAFVLCAEGCAPIP